MLTWKWLLIIVFFLWLAVLWSRRKYYELILKIPGPIGYPIFGMAVRFMKREEVLTTFEWAKREYGSLIFSWLGPFPFLVISDPQIAQDVLNSPHCINKGIIYSALDDGTGRGLFSLKNPEWSKHRKLINPAFAHKVLLSFLPIFNKEINNLMLHKLDKEVGKGETDLTRIIQQFTLNVATQTTLGKSPTSDHGNEENNFLDDYCCVLETMTDMIFCPWLSLRFVRLLLRWNSKYETSKKRAHGYIVNLIKEKLAKGGEILPEENKNTFINLALELQQKGEFTWRQVADEANVMVFGAFETTANTIIYTLTMLSMFPQYQQKVFEELLTVLPERGACDVSYADIQQLTYLDMVINETMRVMAPVPLISRQTTAEVELSNGIVLPEGVQIAIDIFNMHRDEQLWGPDATMFNPENFLPTNLEGKHSYSFIPFTKGLRNCIGGKYGLMSAKVALVKLLRHYRFTTSFNFYDLSFIEDITIKLKKIPLLELHRRER